VDYLADWGGGGIGRWASRLDGNVRREVRTDRIDGGEVARGKASKW